MLLNPYLDGQGNENITSENYTLREFVHSLGASTPLDLRNKFPFLFEEGNKFGNKNSVMSRLAMDLDSMVLHDEGKATSSTEFSCEDSASPSSRTLSSVSLLGSNDSLVLSMGGDTGGLPPHKHAASWLGLVLGRKHWTFLPPSALSPAAFTASRIKVSGDSLDLYAQAALNSPSLWSKELRAILRGELSDDGGVMRGGQGLLECAQRPSEVMYVPANWWHSTFNHGDAIAIGAQAEQLFSYPLLKLTPTHSNREPHTSPTNGKFASESNIKWTVTNKGCASTLTALCTSVKHYPLTSREGEAIRQVIQEITATTDNEDHRRRGGVGLVKGEAGSPEENLDICNAVAQRQILKLVTDLEPLNIKHIIAYAKGLYTYPLEHLSNKIPNSLSYNPIVSSTGNPVLRAAKFIYGKVKQTYQQFQKHHISAVDAKQLILRMGLFLDELPALGGVALACPNTPPHKNRTLCGTWGMNSLSDKKYRTLLNATVRIYNKFPSLDKDKGPSDTDTTTDGRVDRVDTCEDGECTESEEENAGGGVQETSPRANRWSDSDVNDDGEL